MESLLLIWDFSLRRAQPSRLRILDLWNRYALSIFNGQDPGIQKSNISYGLYWYDVDLKKV